jgi:hypothetical protein
MTQFPDDENGDALRHMAEHGVDLSAEHKVEFEHVFSDEASARSFAEAVSALVLETAVRGPEDEDDDEWEVLCRLRLVPSYTAICEIEQRLDEKAGEFDGYSDGWGLLSKPDGTPID